MTLKALSNPSSPSSPGSSRTPISPGSPSNAPWPACSPGEKAASLGRKTKIDNWLNPAKENCNDENINENNAEDENVNLRTASALPADELAWIKQQNYAEIRRQFNICARESSSSLDGGVPSDKTSTEGGGGGEIARRHMSLPRFPPRDAAEPVARLSRLSLASAEEIDCRGGSGDSDGNGGGASGYGGGDSGIGARGDGCVSVMDRQCATPEKPGNGGREEEKGTATTPSSTPETSELSVIDYLKNPGMILRKLLSKSPSNE